MIAVMVAKWTADAFGKEGIYSLWIAMRKYPWLQPVDYRDNGETAAQFMIPAANLVLVEDGVTLEEMGRLVVTWPHAGFPVVNSEKKLIGFVVRENVREFIGMQLPVWFPTSCLILTQNQSSRKRARRNASAASRLWRPRVV